MTRTRLVVRSLLALALVLATVPVLVTGAPVGSQEAKADHPELARLRNIGKAYFENGITLTRALETFEKAVAMSPGTAEDRVNLGLALLRLNRLEAAKAELERAASLAPSLVHPRYALGLLAKRRSDFGRAARELEEALRLDPASGQVAFQLGLAYKELGEAEKAERLFEKATLLAPSHVGAHFQLYQAFLQRGRTADADRHFKVFTDLKRSASFSRADQDPERSVYAEPIAAAAAPAGAAAPARVRFVAVPPTGDLAAVPPLRAILAVDLDLDGASELLAVASTGNGAVTLFGWPTEGPWKARTAEAGLDGAAAPHGLVVGGLANSRYPDIWTPGEARGLWRAATKPGGRPSYLRRDGDRPPVASPVYRAALVDFDHDNDLDLLVVGAGAALLRNDGDGAFTDVSATVDPRGLPADAVDAAAADLDNGLASDLVLLGRDASVTIYRDLKGGRFRRVGVTPGLAGAKEGYRLLVEDLDNDGLPDLVAATDVGVVLYRNEGGSRFREVALDQAAIGLGAAPRLVAVADLDNDGFADLAAADRSSARVAVLMNHGRLAFERDERATAALRGAPPLVSLEVADLDGDGAPDMVGATADGRAALFRNEGGSPHGWLRVALAGVKGVRDGTGARVEVRSGTHYVRRRAAGPVVQLGLGRAAGIDALRITWPNGFVQNELAARPGKTLEVREAERVSGSCPTIFTWNGERFVFVTDAFMSGPMGVPLGPGRYFPVDHDEHVLIPGGALAEKGGRLLVRFTEELREVVYLDRARLFAVDRPAGVEVVPNERFAPPPFPEPGLHTIVRGRPPARATDDAGEDVSALVASVDGRWPHGFRQRDDYPGLADLHTLTLDLGDLRGAPRVMLYLTGWFSYFEASTLVALGQQSRLPFVPPKLEVRDAAGNWVTAIESIGLPPGKGKTVPVDLTGRFPAGDYRVRIVTNLAVYWDRILVDASGVRAPVVTTEAELAEADVHFRGFARPIVHPERLAPERFDYHEVTFDVPWGQTPGLYTRYGDVRPLLTEPDDRYVIFGAGDEVSLAFDASRLPPVPAGWGRDYVLYLEGWVKDGDPNTAFSGSVGPLPFHGMSGYPYGEEERFPDGPAHREWMAAYNTRPAVRLWPPLAGSGSRLVKKGRVE